LLFFSIRQIKKRGTYFVVRLPRLALLFSQTSIPRHWRSLVLGKNPDKGLTIVLKLEVKNLLQYVFALSNAFILSYSINFVYNSNARYEFFRETKFLQDFYAKPHCIYKNVVINHITDTIEQIIEKFL